MIIRYVEDLKDTDREVAHGNWVSRRFILRKDKMGFSFHENHHQGRDRKPLLVRQPFRGRLLRCR